MKKLIMFSMIVGLSFGSVRQGHSDSMDVRDIIGSFEDLKNVSQGELKKGHLTWIPKYSDLTAEDMALDFSSEEDQDLSDPFLQEGKVKLSILDDQGKVSKQYTFLVDPKCVQKDKVDLTKKNKVRYHVSNSAEEDFEVVADIYVAKIKFSKVNAEKSQVCDYLKVVSLVVLKEISFAKMAEAPKLIGKYRSGNDDEFELACH